MSRSLPVLGNAVVRVLVSAMCSCAPLWSDCFSVSIFSSALLAAGKRNVHVLVLKVSPERAIYLSGWPDFSSMLEPDRISVESAPKATGDPPDR